MLMSPPACGPSPVLRHHGSRARDRTALLNATRTTGDEGDEDAMAWLCPVWRRDLPLCATFSAFWVASAWADFITNAPTLFTRRLWPRRDGSHRLMHLSDARAPLPASPHAACSATWLARVPYQEAMDSPFGNDWVAHAMLHFGLFGGGLTAPWTFCYYSAQPTTRRTGLLPRPPQRHQRPPRRSAWAPRAASHAQLRRPHPSSNVLELSP